MGKPLEGLRILDFTQFMSGPICTLILSDFGAEVIKIENPPLGDNTRYGNVMDRGASSHYATRNRGKKSIILNMKDEAQKNLFLKLVKTADAVVDNYKPGTLEKFGITYELLEKINPKIVWTSISGYGQTGPFSNHAAFDATVQAESGLMSINGEDGGSPLKTGPAIADYCGGLCGCIGTMMGLFDAQRTGRGRRVDASMMDSLIFLFENQFSSYLRSGKVPGPIGNRYPMVSPVGDFMCRDGIPLMLNISTDRQWEGFAKALDQQQWLEDPDFASMFLRGKNYEKVEAEVNRVFMEHDSEEIAAKLQAHGCVYGRVNNFDGVKNHPQVTARKMIVRAIYENGVQFQVPGDPIHMSGMERDMEYKAAALGQNTFEILKEVESEETLHQMFDPLMAKVQESVETMLKKS